MKKTGFIPASVETACLIRAAPLTLKIRRLDRGWSAEDVENNLRDVQRSKALREGAEALVGRAVDVARLLIAGYVPERRLPRGGRKTHESDVKAQT